MSRQQIYLDYAAATPLDERVIEVMQPYLIKDFYNPSASYADSRRVKAELEAARASIAHHLGSRSSEIIFTAGATEANNLAIHGVMRRYPSSNIVISSIEHESVEMPAQQYDHRKVKVKADGRIDLDHLEKQIDKNTVLVSIMYANNEIGTIQPLRDISKIIEAKRAGRSDRPLYFHADAAQAGNYLDLHVSRLGVDLMTINGGKIYGPKQSGALYIKAGIELQPLILGGGQERGLRSGTENVAASIGLATALDLAQDMRRSESLRLKELQQKFFELVELNLPGVVINGSRKYRLPNNVHLTFVGLDNERLIIQLDELKILASAGSACSASSQEPSHVLSAIDLSKSDIQSSLRFTMGRATTLQMIEACVSELKKLA
jgi:cysteine desulfurase